MVGRPVVQALHGDDDGGGLALGPEPADVVARAPGRRASRCAGRRGPRSAGRHWDGLGAANDSKPGVPNGHGHTATRGRHATNAIAEAPANPA